MGLVTVPQCNVYGSFRNIKVYRIVITQVDERGGLLVDAAGNSILEEMNTTVFLSPRGKRRLLKFIVRGTTSPSGKEGKRKE